MSFYRAGQVDSLEVNVGETFRLESLREAVVPPYLMLTPFIKVPPGITFKEPESLGEDGVHAHVYTLKAESPTQGELIIGYKDSLTNEVTHEKTISIRTR